MTWQLCLPGLPGSTRPQAVRRGARAGLTMLPRYRRWREAAEAEVRAALESGRLTAYRTEMVQVELLVVVCRPSSPRPAAGLPREHYTGKPDVDNAAKAALDALTSAGAWTDDTQVVRLVVERVRGELAPGVGADPERWEGSGIWCRVSLFDATPIAPALRVR